MMASLLARMPLVADDLPGRRAFPAAVSSRRRRPRGRMASTRRCQKVAVVANRCRVDGARVPVQDALVGLRPVLVGDRLISASAIWQPARLATNRMRLSTPAQRVDALLDIELWLSSYRSTIQPALYTSGVGARSGGQRSPRFPEMPALQEIGATLQLPPRESEGRSAGDRIDHVEPPGPVGLARGAVAPSWGDRSRRPLLGYDRTVDGKRTAACAEPTIRCARSAASTT